MKNVVVAALMALSFTACKRNVTVRDAKVYKAQAKYMKTVSDQQAEALETFINAHCKCTGDADAPKWSSVECEEAAEILVIQRATVQYRFDMMMYLGSLSEERPSEEVPEIPPNTSVCPQ